jgi:ankyrin repeat protein
MKLASSSLCLVVLLASAGCKQTTSDASQGDLAIAISLTQDHSGSNIIDHGGSFQVLFTNLSAKPIRLWSDKSELGYGTLSFRIVDADGRTWAIDQPSGRGTYHDIPDLTETIPPRDTVSREIEPSRGIPGMPEWRDLPEPNTGERYKLEAILEIKPSHDADVRGVWTGRVSSKPVETLFVNPRLRTPQEYLFALCPQQALRVLQSDPTWIGKTDADQCTPLHRAVELGPISVVRWLLEHGADANAIANHRSTPLHFARDPAAVAELLRYRPDLERRGGGWDKTVLEQNADLLSRLTDDEQALAANCRTIIGMLLNAGAYYDIHTAIYLNDVKRVREILDGGLIDRSEPRQSHASCLRLASEHGHAEICKLLIEHDPGSNNVEKWLDFSVLQNAIKYPAVVKTLIECGSVAGVRISNNYNGLSYFSVGDQASLLHYAVGADALESAKLLIEANVPVNAVDDSGETPLHVAAGHGRVEMMRLLLRHGGDRNARNRLGWTPLDVAQWHEERFGDSGTANVLRGEWFRGGHQGSSLPERAGNE